MGLDITMHCIYGFHTVSKENKSVHDLEKYITDKYGEKRADSILGGSIKESLRLIIDGMCGNYEYFGIPLYKSDEYTQEHKAIKLDDLAWLDHKLKSVIQESYSSMNYSEMVKIFGEPQLHLFIHVN